MNLPAEQPYYIRPLVPNGRRRAPWHDYYGRCIYMITLNRRPGLGPLSEIRGRLDSYEWRPRVCRTPLGEIFSRQLSNIRNTFPLVNILRSVVMPDHVHFVLFNTAAGNYHLGEVIRHLKAACTRALHNLPDGDPANSQGMFEDDYHDRILTKEGQLQRMLDYVSANPRRRLERQTYGTYHRRCLIRHRDGTQYEAYGNIHLLQDYDIEAVKVSRSYRPEELVAKKWCWKHTVDNGGVLVSPFVHPDERKVRDWAVDNGGRIIHIERNGFGPRYTPKGTWHQLVNEGRLLIIAPVEHSTAEVPCTYAGNKILNDLAAAIAAGEYAAR